MVNTPRFTLLVLVTLLGLNACSSPDPVVPDDSPYSAGPEPETALRQNLTRRMLNPIMGDPDKLKRAGIPNVRDLRMTATAIPAEFSLSSTKRIDVALAVGNEGKQAINLWFPNAQRIEILVKNQAGEILSRWSDDEKFGQETGYLVINPEETITYAETISTREMTAGQPAIIEAFIAGYPDLRAIVKVIPAP